jgi:hypothetical protein
MTGTGHHVQHALVVVRFPRPSVTVDDCSLTRLFGINEDVLSLLPIIVVYVRTSVLPSGPKVSPVFPEEGPPNRDNISLHQSGRHHRYCRQVCDWIQ